MSTTTEHGFYTDEREQNRDFPAENKQSKQTSVTLNCISVRVAFTVVVL